MSNSYEKQPITSPPLSEYGNRAFVSDPVEFDLGLIARLAVRENGSSQGRGD
jgi:hypothetical protein